MPEKKQLQSAFDPNVSNGPRNNSKGLLSFKEMYEIQLQE
jgi:hypothetical protein